MFYLVILGIGIKVGGEVIDIYFYYVIGMLYFISFVVLGVGGIYYVVLGLKKFDLKGFGYNWEDGNKMIIILGIYLVLLGFGVVLLVIKVIVLGGIYDLLVEKVWLV